MFYEGYYNLNENDDDLAPLDNFNDLYYDIPAGI